MLVTVEEVQGKDGIQQSTVYRYGSSPVEILQAANLFEACGQEVDFQVAVIPSGYLVRQDYLEKGGIVQLVPPSQSQPLR
jgi:hypothetical protein